MDKLNFWLLDYWYHVEFGHPTVYLSGFLDNGERVILRDEHHRPYFFVRLNKGETPDLDYSHEDIKYVKLKEDTFKRRWFMQVFGQVPDEIPSMAESVRDHGLKTYANDLYFSIVYTKDKGFVPCSWQKVYGIIEDEHELDGFTEFTIDVFKVIPYSDTPPKLYPISLDIECYNPLFGMPDSRVNPIIVMGLKANDKQKVFKAPTTGDSRRWDRLLLPLACDWCIDYHPDLYGTYNGNDFDWDYISDRSSIIGSAFDLGWNGAVPRRTEYSTISIEGYPAIDVYGYAWETGSKRKTQYRVHEWMAKNKMVPKRKYYEIDRDHIAYMWDNSQEDEVIQHCESDITCSHDILTSVLPFAIELSRVSNVPIDQCLSVSEKTLIENYLYRWADKLGYVIPNTVERELEGSKGAIVLSPVAGIHHNVVVFDFKSMHPNIAVKNNISFETYQNGEWLKEPKGLFTYAVENLIREVGEAKKKFKTKYTTKYAGEVQAIKRIARAASPHGYLGGRYARWYSYEAKVQQLKIVRKVALKTIFLLRRHGFNVIYGDTDSMFVPFKTIDKGRIERVMSLIQKEVGMEVDYEVYNKIFFTEAKKKYIYLDKNDEINFVGFETARGDWSPIATRTQTKIANIVIRQEDPEKALRYAILVVKTIKNNPIEDFIISKRLSKSLEKYEGNLSHVEVAKRKGTDISGAVEYVIGQGNVRRPQSERARHISEVKSLADLDMDYYVNNQVIAAAGRILGYFIPDFAERIKESTKGYKVFEVA